MLLHLLPHLTQRLLNRIHNLLLTPALRPRRTGHARGILLVLDGPRPGVRKLSMLRQNFIKYFLLGYVRFRNVELLIIPFARATRLLVVAIVLGVVVAEEAGVLSVSKILLETTFGFGVDVSPYAQERE
jgi:hypothetical protein